MRTKDIPDNKIIFLCGSTKFKQQYEDMAFRFTLKGYVVLVPAVYQHADSVVYDKDTKTRIKQLDKVKIDLADSVYVVNPGGYIGSSTLDAIEYANKTGKTIEFLEPPTNLNFIETLLAEKKKRNQKQ